MFIEIAYGLLGFSFSSFGHLLDYLVFKDWKSCR